MGYESRLYVGKRFECRDLNTNEVRFVAFIKEAEFNLDKMCDENFRTGSRIFNKPVDFKINEYDMVKEISYDKERDVTTGEFVDSIDEDRYGDHLCYGTPEDVLDALMMADKEYESPKLKRVIYYFQSLCSANHENIIVVHYGY